MFTVPSRNAIISIFYPIGSYREEEKWINKSEKKVRGRIVRTPGRYETRTRGFFEARLNALNEVSNDLFYGVCEGALFGTAFYIAVRCLDWVKF